MPSDTFPSQPSPSSLADETSELAPSVELASQHIPPTSRRILVINSSVEVADQLVHLVEEMGHKVEIAADAKTAMLHLKAFQPHLVFLGTYLADMPGYELTAILKSAPQYSGSLHAVGLLYIADRAKLLKHRMIGAPDVPISHYIFKPINPTEVRVKMDKEIARAMAIRYAPQQK